MYTYDKNDKSYTFSMDELDIDKIIDASGADSHKGHDTNNITEDTADSQENNINDLNENKKHKEIEFINGGNDLDISPVTDYLEIEKPKSDKKENIIVPKHNK